MSADDKKTLAQKILSPFMELRDMFAEVSPRFVIFVTAGVLFCVLIVGLVLIFADPTGKPENVSIHSDFDENKVHVKIREGMTTGEIAQQLADKGVITSSLKFRFLARVRGYDGKMKPGTYTFSENMSDDDVFEKLMTGEKHLVRFTIPEGFGVKEIAERLYDLDLVDREDFLNAAENFAPYSYMKRRPNVRYSAEGFLFPDTYDIESDYSVDEILNTLSGEFDKRLTPEMRARAENMGLSVYDLVTLASLVEREVRYPEDRAIVAQVFLKRLKMDMPLQTDASLQYLLDEPKEDVTIEDTKIDSPYNTYQNAGLPPGPIANPGIESIEAVLNPADTDYLYFVADRDGHNHYAYTYDEHLNLVNEYR